jgi:transposase
VPQKTILEIPADEQEQMLRELRQARYGYLLGLHILLLCAAGRAPTEIASFLFCSRSSVYRTVETYRQGKFAPCWTNSGQMAEARPASKLLSWQRSLVALLKRAPAAFGWCRTRWSCQALSLQLATRPGYAVSRETVRRTLHQLGYVWKRARHAARDDDPERASKLARIRYLIEDLPKNAALFFADEVDINLLAKLGYEWMLTGTQREVETPRSNKKNYLGGALSFMTGKLLHVVGEKKDRWLFIRLLDEIDRASPAVKFKQVYVIVDNYKIHKAQAVLTWLAKHPRFELIYLPSYCPKANPIERAFGDVHDKCTRNHKRKRLRDLVADVVRHLQVNGPWRYRLSKIYYEPEVTRAVAELKAAAQLQAA